LKLHTLKLFLLLCAAVLSSCGDQQVKPDDESIDIARPATERQTTLAEEAEIFVALAEDSDTEAEQHIYRAQAGKLFVDAGDIESARNQLDNLKELSESKALTASILLLSGEIAVAEKNLLSANDIIVKIKPVIDKQN